RLAANGLLDASFGSGGRAPLPDGILFASSVRIVPLADGGALVAASGNNGPASIVKLTAAGALDASYGTAGVASVTAAGYQDLAFVGGFADESGFAALAGTFSRLVSCTLACFRSGNDAGVLVLTSTGQLATGYGQAGVAVWDRAESSSDSIDSLYTLPSGASVFAG